MWCPSDWGAGAEDFFYNLLSELCWVDDRGRDWQRAQRNVLWGSQRVYGQFRDLPLRLRDCTIPIVSVYAQVACQLGYFLPQRMFPATQMNDLFSVLDAHFFDRDWHRSELHSRFGLPSFECGGGGLTLVDCYAFDDVGRPWMFFDFAQSSPRSVDLSSDPPLRAVRTGTQRVRFLPAANCCRGFCRAWPLPSVDPDDIMSMSVVAIEGNRLDQVSDVFEQSPFTIESIHREASQQDAYRHFGNCNSDCRTTVMAYLTDRWTYLVDPQMVLMASDGWCELSRAWNARVFGWSYSSDAAGLTLFRDGERMRDFLHAFERGALVDRGVPLAAESGIDWEEATEVDLLRIASEVGAPYDAAPESDFTVIQLHDRFACQGRSWRAV